ncbi:MAG: hypothetical protein LBP92_13190 [Deltaproteobacteria bacterium]|jgi:hypothetical protein|nr:hypothetical protein [Deltaproteobacteria bacterium]
MSFFRNLFKSVRPIWVIGILLLLGAIGWALDGLEAQANKSAANAGNLSAGMALTSMDTIKPPKATASKPAPNVDWAQERAVKSRLDAQEKSLNALIAQGNSQQAANGAVTGGLAGQLRSAAQQYQQTSQQYADIWAKGNCTTRANLAREAGDSAVASVEVVIAGADGDKISELNSRQSALSKARQAYLREAKANGELSSQDITSMRSTLVPRAQQFVKEATGLVTEVTGLLDQIRSQVGSLASPDNVIGSVTACAGGGGGGGGPEDIAKRLLSPVTSLLSLVQGLATSASGLVSDLGSLG